MILEYINGVQSNLELPLHKNHKMFIIKDENTIVASGIMMGDNKILNLTFEKEKAIQYLIDNNYFDLYFTLDYINWDVIEKLLKSNYNSPYIVNFKSLPIDTLNLIYNKEMKKCDCNIVRYLLGEYRSSDKTVCKGCATFNKQSLREIRESILDPTSGEISGKLDIVSTVDEINKPCFEVALKGKVQKGESVEADTVESRYNYHTHPVGAYKIYNCELGWPSKDDYIIFVCSCLKSAVPTMFHCVFTVEGVYILSIPKDSVNELNKFMGKDLDEKVDEYINRYLEVDKLGFKCSEGIEKKGYPTIRCSKTYIDYLNLRQKKHPFKIKYKGQELSFKLLNVTFCEWDGTCGILNQDPMVKRVYFTYYYPKINGNCVLLEEHVRAKSGTKKVKRTRERKKK